MFRHIDYVAELVGPEHVGIGTDYVKQYPVSDFADWWQAVDGAEWPWGVDAWPDPSGTQIPNGEGRCFAPAQLPGLVAEMLDHGYSRETIAGILGGNFRRVYAAAAR
jgi:membrane dipeptidase